MNLNRHSLDTTERIRPVRGGFLRQPNYTNVLDLKHKDLIITMPDNHDGLTELDIAEIIFAWAIGCTSNSNTTTLVREAQLLGNGVGQQSRVASCQVAVFRAKKSGHQTGAAVAYTDSFCPQPDAPEVLAAAGVSILFASSGSINDAIVQETCKKRNLILVQLPDKLFRGFFGH
jgi:AICAR transformylase/IMP cyclohydrolase PurH